MRILLADDSRAMRMMFRGVLERLGHAAADLLEAPDGTEAMAALRKPGAAVDAAIYDWDLPGLGGQAWMQQLKSLGLTEKMTVLFCISRAQRSLVTQAARVGPCDFLERPFTEEGFEAKVRKLDGLVAANKARESSKHLHAGAPAAPAPEADAGLPFLIQLPSVLIDEMLKAAVVRRYDVGAVLLRPGQLCDALHLVTKGRVEILAGAAGHPDRSVGEGDPFGELAFMTSQPSAETVRAQTLVQTASLSRAKLADLLRTYPELARHLSALVARHQKALSARATTLEHSDFKGTFDTFPFSDVLQMLITTKKTGVLGIRGDDGGGAVYLEEGEAVHAWTDEIQGEEAFYVLAGWRKAKFAFTSIQRQEPRTLKLPTITLLMNAVRRQEAGTQKEDVGMDDLFPPAPAR